MVVPVKSNVQTIAVELKTFILVVLMVSVPLDNITVEPLTNPTPVMVEVNSPVFAPLFGVIKLTSIGVIRNPAGKVAENDPIPPVLTITSQWPVVRPAKSKVQMMAVELKTLTPVAFILADPDDSVTVELPANPLPVMVEITSPLFIPLLGDTEYIVIGVI